MPPLPQPIGQYGLPLPARGGHPVPLGAQRGVACPRLLHKRDAQRVMDRLVRQGAHGIEHPEDGAIDANEDQRQGGGDGEQHEARTALQVGPTGFIHCDKPDWQSYEQAGGRKEQQRHRDLEIEHLPPLRVNPQRLVFLPRPQQ